MRQGCRSGGFGRQVGGLLCGIGESQRCAAFGIGFPMTRHPRMGEWVLRGNFQLPCANLLTRIRKVVLRLRAVSSVVLHVLLLPVCV
jgi:hypothetical protein